MEGGIGESNFLDDFDDEAPARHDEGKFAGFHSENLYDEDEDGAGEKTRLDTGKPIDNSTYTGMETLRNQEPGEGGSEDVLGAVDDGTHDDEAARWLREHDTDLQ